MLKYLATSVFLGWSLGSNDAANVFGTAVSSKMVRFWTAAVLASIFVLVGAMLEGRAGIETLSRFSVTNLEAASVMSIAAAVTVTIMTTLKLPVSTSQAVVGSIIGVNLMAGRVTVEGLGKIVLCWVGTPIGGGVISVILYLLLAKIVNRLRPSFISFDIAMRIGLILAGCYGAYALGANNVANVTAVFVGPGMLTVEWAALIGGVSIALGILTYSRGVMGTVGSGIVKLDAFSALVVVLSEAITVHIYAMVGVPVSTSQAVVGAVIGIGLLKRAEAIRMRAIVGIFTGWLMTPVVGAILAALTFLVLHLKYVPAH
jgi:PiT family inorganic phosphate transporter